jgi:hypothetical protein
MAHKSWTIKVDGKTYQIELKHSYFSGHRTILINGNKIYDKKSQYIDFGDSTVIRVNNSYYEIEIKSHGLYFQYNLRPFKQNNTFLPSTTSDEYEVVDVLNQAIKNITIKKQNEFKEYEEIVRKHQSTHSAEQFQETIQFGKGVQQFILYTSIILSVLAFFGPSKIQTASLYVLTIIPIVCLLLPRFLTAFTFNNYNAKLPSLEESFIGCALALTFKATDRAIVNFTNCWILIIIGWFLCLVLLRPIFKWHPKYAIIQFFTYGLFLLIYLYGAIIFLNCNLDKQGAMTYQTFLKATKKESGRYRTRYFVTIDNFLDSKQSMTLESTEEEFIKLKMGSKIDIFIQPGFLYIPWVKSIKPCHSHN